MEFRHIVRVAATELKGKTPVKIALTKIKGIGPAISNAIIEILDLDPNKKIGDFEDLELSKLEEFLTNMKEVPEWMMNRKKDPVTGNTHHLVSTDLKLSLKNDTDFMKMIKSYRGRRHAFGLKVRGQRTKSTGRRGKTVGVHRKKLKK